MVRRNLDGFVKSPNLSFPVIPAQAVVRQAHHPERSRRRIQGFQLLMNIQSSVTEGFGTFFDAINLTFRIPPASSGLPSVFFRHLTSDLYLMPYALFANGWN